MSDCCGGGRLRWFLPLGLLAILAAYLIGVHGTRETPPSGEAGGGAILQLTDKTFDQSTGKGVVLVDFWAPWCGWCKSQKPILEAMAATLPDGARIVQVNTDESTKVAERFAIEGLPTLIILKDGKEAKRFVGLQQAAALRSAIKELL